MRCRGGQRVRADRGRTVAKSVSIVGDAVRAEPDLTCEGGVPEVDAMHASEVGGRQAVHAIRDGAQRRHHACVPCFKVTDSMQVGQKLACA